MRPSLPQSAVGGFTEIVRHLIDFRPAFRNKLAMLADAKMQMSIRWILMRLRDEVAKHKNTIRYWSRPPRGECEGSFLDKVISEAAYKAGMRNAIRFQGQYYDEETGLHFNRNRYYDPHSGRFISKDPISLEGGINLHLYAPNTTDWTDPLGLAPRRPAHESSIQRKVSCLKSQGFQELHIISDKNSQTKSHPLIGLAGFDLQSQANKIYLPNDGSLHPERSIHNGRHPNIVSTNLAKQMDDIVELGRQQGWGQQQYDAALRSVIARERVQLKAGNRMLNKNHRPWACPN